MWPTKIPVWIVLGKRVKILIFIYGLDMYLPSPSVTHLYHLWLMVKTILFITVFRLVNRWRSGSRTDGPSGKNTTPWRRRNPQTLRRLPPRRQRDSVAAAAAVAAGWSSVRRRPRPAPSSSAKAMTTRRWKTRRAATAAWTRPSPRWSRPGRPSRCRPRRRRRTTRQRPRPLRRPPWPGRPVRGKAPVVFLKIL